MPTLDRVSMSTADCRAWKPITLIYAAKHALGMWTLLVSHTAKRGPQVS